MKKPYYEVDDNFETIACSTIEQANKKADELKKANPLRTVYISKVTQGVNGDETEVIAEA